MEEEDQELGQLGDLAELEEVDMVVVGKDHTDSGIGSVYWKPVYWVKRGDDFFEHLQQWAKQPPMVKP